MLVTWHFIVAICVDSGLWLGISGFDVRLGEISPGQAHWIPQDFNKVLR